MGRCAKPNRQASHFFDIDESQKEQIMIAKLSELDLDCSAESDDVLLEFDETDDGPDDEAVAIVGRWRKLMEGESVPSVLTLYQQLNTLWPSGH